MPLARACPAHLQTKPCVRQPIGAEVFREDILLLVDTQGWLWPGAYWPAPFKLLNFFYKHSVDILTSFCLAKYYKLVLPLSLV